MLRTQRQIPESVAATITKVYTFFNVFFIDSISQYTEQQLRVTEICSLFPTCFLDSFPKTWDESGFFIKIFPLR